MASFHYGNESNAGVVARPEICYGADVKVIGGPSRRPLVMTKMSVKFVVRMAARCRELVLPADGHPVNTDVIEFPTDGDDEGREDRESLA